MTEWNLKQLYKSDKDPQIEIDINASKKKIQDFVKKWKDTDEYLKDPKVLKDAFLEYEKVEEDINKAVLYVFLRQEQDQTNPEIKQLYNQISDTVTKLGNELVFFELNISKIPEETQKIFLESPELKDYHHYLEKTFKIAQYLLTDKEEKVFNLLAKPSTSNWSKMIEELLSKQTLHIIDEDGKPKDISYNENTKYLLSTKENVRKKASEELNRVHEKYLEIAEFEMNSLLEAKKLEDDYRGIERADIPRHISDDIDTEVVDALVKVVTENFHISQKYYKLKAELLGKKKLAYHERSLSIGKNETEYTYEDSMVLVKKVFGQLDSEFLNIVEMFEKNGHYDVFPKQGKTGGAFCVNISKYLPTYILLNHTNRLVDVTTIAHESGHGIHAELSKSQNDTNAGHPISLGEVASKFFEDLVLDDISKSLSDDKEKLVLIMERLNDDISSIFRQVACYNFEKDLHKEFREKGFLSKEYISELFCKHMSAYLGDSVEIDEGMKSGWIYWTHIRDPFYVYSYSSGLLISKGLQSMVREDRKNIDKVKMFLSSGSSLSPKDLFMKIGIDITDEEFWKKGLNDVENLLETAQVK
jgi:oligoendopeptidase F